jgi:aromatic-L-amino-acid/L-tryptophan decarboxylase
VRRLDVVQLAPVPLNVVCFRFHPSGRTQAELNDLNQEILMRVQESGVAVPSSTLRDGRFAIRVAITNHRSRRDGFEVFIAAVRRIGREVSTALAMRAV